MIDQSESIEVFKKAEDAVAYAYQIAKLGASGAFFPRPKNERQSTDALLEEEEKYSGRECSYICVTFIVSGVEISGNTWRWALLISCCWFTLTARAGVF